MFYYYDTNIQPHMEPSRTAKGEMYSWDYSALSSGSAGAHSTQRPVAFPLAARSTMLGCEQVTACDAVILFIVINSKRRARERDPKCDLTFSHLIILPVDRPWPQRY